MLNLDLPRPDFEAFKEVLMGRKMPDKTYFVELMVDYEVMNFIVKKRFGNTFPSLTKVKEEKERRFLAGEQKNDLTIDEMVHWKNRIKLYYRMGYDCLDVSLPLAPFATRKRVTRDTALLSRGERRWVEEKAGVITSWEEFDLFPWDHIQIQMDDYFEFFNRNLPDGMKVTIGSTLFERVGEHLMGWECMFRKLFLDPDLVRAVFNAWGQVIYDTYSEAIKFDCVGAIFHRDDLGYKKGMMVSPKILREIVFPWFKKYVSLAHGKGKMFWYHCCGKVSQIMEDLIEDVKIDGFHSFQDVVLPVWEFKKMYGDKIAVLGGVDVDKLARYNESQLREYVRTILDRCMPGGRFALGSGNSVANYVPPKNYLAMLDEGYKWRP